MPDHRPRLDARVEIAPVAIHGGERLGHIGHPRGGGRGAEPVADRSPQNPFVECDAAGERNPSHRMHGQQLHPEGDAAAGRSGVDAHVVEAAEAEEVRDAVPQIAGGERLPDVRDDQIRQRRIGGGGAVECDR